MSDKSSQGSLIIIGATVLVMLVIGLLLSGEMEDSGYQTDIQTALQEEKIKDFEVFGDRNQYVAVDYTHPTYFNSEDNVAEMLMGRNHFVRFYDSTKGTHEAYIVAFDIENQMKKRVINLTEQLEKLPEYKQIKEMSATLRNVDGYDYLFFRSQIDGDKKRAYYAYNLDKDEFLTKDIPDFQLSKDERVYFGSKKFQPQYRPSAMWKFFGEASNLYSFLESIPVEYPNVEVEPNVIFDLDGIELETAKEINLFARYPRVKEIYEKQEYRGFSILTRQGEKGVFPPAPKEPIKPEKTDGFPSPFPKLAEVDLLDILYQEELDKFEKEMKDYQKELQDYQNYRAEQFDKQTNLYFSPEEQTNDILNWLSTDPNQSLVLTFENKEGEKTEVKNFADFKKWLKTNRETVERSTWYSGYFKGN